MNDELVQRLREAAQHIALPDQEREHQASVLAGVHERLDSRAKLGRFTQRGMLVLAVAAGIVVGLSIHRLGWRSTATPSQLSRTETLLEGSLVTGLTEAARWHVIEGQRERVRLALDQGAARFEVSHVAERSFEIEVDGLTVKAIGTDFLVLRAGPAQVWVAVRAGRVRVQWSRGEVELGPGAEGTFPPTDETRRDGVSPTEGSPSPSTAETSSVSDFDAPLTASPTVGGWRGFAKAGDTEKAFAVLSSKGVGDSLGTTPDLLLAADVARKAGHPEQALSYLQRAIDNHPNDGQAPVAAFTKGRLLMQLGRAKEAAQSFARVQALEPSGPLTEDAMAKEADAWQKAGNEGEARAAARRYLTRFPKGIQADRFRRFGSLE
jgi:transmembrane sensor